MRQITVDFFLSISPVQTLPWPTDLCDSSLCLPQRPPSTRWSLAQTTILLLLNDLGEPSVAHEAAEPSGLVVRNLFAADR